jgi:integrase
MLSEIVLRAERGLQGLVDASDLARPVTELVELYRDHLRRSGSGEKHVRLTGNCLLKVLDKAKLDTAADLLTPGAKLRVESVVASLGLSAVTKKYYLRDLKSFTTWLHQEAEVLPKNPFDWSRRRGGKASRTEAPRRARSPLSPEQLAKLLDSTRSSSRVYRGLSGIARSCLYATAAGTGLRCGELASLTINSFDLESPATVSIRADKAKSGKADTLPLPPGVVIVLREYLAGRSMKELAWPGSWHERAAEMIRDDLAEAGLDYSTDVNGVKQYSDFHALRHFFTTQLVAAGASVKTAQRLARHSTPILTIGTYSHTNANELAAVSARLPIGKVEQGINSLSRAEIEGFTILLLETLKHVLGVGSAHTCLHTGNLDDA